MPYSREVKQKLADHMQRNPTPAEAALWERLKDGRTGYRFRAQVIQCGYIADFLCSQARLVVEIDGNSHTGRDGYDGYRDMAFARFGFRTLRFTNRDVLTNIEAVVGRIAAKLQEPLPERFGHIANPHQRPVGLRIRDYMRAGKKYQDAVGLAFRGVK